MHPPSHANAPWFPKSLCVRSSSFFFFLQVKGACEAPRPIGPPGTVALGLSGSRLYATALRTGEVVCNVLCPPVPKADPINRTGQYRVATGTGHDASTLSLSLSRALPFSRTCHRPPPESEPPMLGVHCLLACLPLPRSTWPEGLPLRSASDKSVRPFPLLNSSRERNSAVELLT